MLAEYPQQAKVWMSYGHALKTAGRSRGSVEAYRRTIELSPQLGEAWWSLANLKTFRFAPPDIAAMRAQLARTDLSARGPLPLPFRARQGARGRAAISRARSRTTRRATACAAPPIHYDADETTASVRRSRALFTRRFLRRSAPAPARRTPDPIFIVGLPRAGSTLVEQILSSHSLVEGTMELPDLTAIVQASAEPARPTLAEPSPLPGGRSHGSSRDQLRALGERYLAQTRIQRKTGAPFFIDKMPNNWAHVGLIHLILPNAKIIDARRHPLSCCFSGLQAAFRPRAALLLQPRRPRPLLPRLRAS